MGYVYEIWDPFIIYPKPDSIYLRGTIAGNEGMEKNIHTIILEHQRGNRWKIWVATRAME